MAELGLVVGLVDVIVGLVDAGKEQWEKGTSGGSKEGRYHAREHISERV